MQKLEEMYNSIEIPNEDSVVTYYKIRQQLAKLAKEIEEYVHKPKYCLPFLQPGRLVKVTSDLSFLLSLVFSRFKFSVCVVGLMMVLRVPLWYKGV